MSWNLQNESSTSGGKAEFTKFPEGITKIRIVDEQPHIRWAHWVQKISRSVNCPGKGCPICEIRRQQKANKEPYTYGMTRRYALNVLNRETGSVEIMEQGITFFEDLRDLLEELESEGKTFFDVDLKVKRRGTGKDGTTYRIDLDEECPLSEEDQKKIDEGKIDLNEFFKPHTVEQLTRLVNGEEWSDIIASSNNDDEDEKVEIA